MRPPPDLDRLRDAWLAAEPEELAHEVDAERVFLAASGALPADERRAVIDQTATDPALARAWRLAHGLLDEARKDGIALEKTSVAHPVRARWHWAAGAAAAVLLAIGLFSLRLTMQQPPAVYRGDDVAIAPSADPPPSCSREGCRFAWTEVPGAVSYRLTVLSEELVPLLELRDLDTHEVAVPAESLSEMLSRPAVLWQVEARLRDERRVLSPTFRLEVTAGTVPGAETFDHDR